MAADGDVRGRVLQAFAQRRTASRRSRTATSATSMGAGDRPAVRLNQLGYLPAGPKRAVWVSDAREPAPFSVPQVGAAPGRVGRAHAALAGPTRAHLRPPRARARLLALGEGDGFASSGRRAQPPVPGRPQALPRARPRRARVLLPAALRRRDRRGPGPGLRAPGGPSGDASVAAWTGSDAERLYPGWSCQAASMSPAAGTTRAITASTSPAGRCPCGSCWPRSS